MCQRSEQLRALMMRDARVHADRFGAQDDLVSWTPAAKWTHTTPPDGRDRWARPSVSPFDPGCEQLYGIGRQ
jgi:hypothetical protein